MKATAPMTLPGDMTRPSMLRVTSQRTFLTVFSPILEWAADQTVEITTTAIDLEFLPSETNVDRGVQNLEFVLQQVHTALMALTSYEANDIVANSRKNPLEAWRRLQKRYGPTTGGRKRNLLRTIISPGRCSLLGLLSGDRTLGVLCVALRDEVEGQVRR